MTELVIVVCNILGVAACAAIAVTLLLIAMDKIHG